MVIRSCVYGFVQTNEVCGMSLTLSRESGKFCLRLMGVNAILQMHLLVPILHKGGGLASQRVSNHLKFCHL